MDILQRFRMGKGKLRVEKPSPTFSVYNDVKCCIVSQPDATNREVEIFHFGGLNDEGSGSSSVKQ